MTAQLQSATASSRPILLLYDTKSGHSGGRPINKQIEENTDILSFLFSQLGVPTNSSARESRPAAYCQPDILRRSRTVLGDRHGDNGFGGHRRTSALSSSTPGHHNPSS